MRRLKPANTEISVPASARAGRHISTAKKISQNIVNTGGYRFSLNSQRVSTMKAAQLITESDIRKSPKLYEDAPRALCTEPKNDRHAKEGENYPQYPNAREPFF